MATTPTDTATASPAITLTPPDPVPVVAPEQAIGLVPVTADQKSKLEEKVESFIADLVSHDANSPEFGKRVDQLTNMGRKEIAATAALNRTEADLMGMEAVLERSGHHRSISERSQDDFAFHLAVAKATGNPFYVNSLTSLREQMMVGMDLSWNLSAGSADYLGVALMHHKAIMEAIRRRDADAAREAMRQHLRWAGARMLRGEDKEAAPKPSTE